MSRRFFRRILPYRGGLKREEIPKRRLEGATLTGQRTALLADLRLSYCILPQKSPLPGGEGEVSLTAGLGRRSRFLGESELLQPIRLAASRRCRVHLPWSRQLELAYQSLQLLGLARQDG
jgi:hypothetical protein